jgi:spermidine synthase
MPFPQLVATPHIFSYATGMSALFEEIAWRQTPIGELALRRRRLHSGGEDIWEIKLDEGYLMSSQFVAGEIALATLALEMVEGKELDVIVGGLGLGYTAEAALADHRVSRLTVVELIPEVIEWHVERKLPLGEAVAGDPRCRLLQGDFFAMSRTPGGFEEDRAPRSYDAVLVDIDHSTRHLIDARSASFYDAPALADLAAQLKPGGVFALWSSEAEDAAFLDAMKATFTDVRAERVEFDHPHRSEPAFNIIYLGRRP